MQEIDEDPDMRHQINLYRKEKMGAYAHSAEAAASEEKEDDGFPEVQLDELLDDLVLEYVPPSLSVSRLYVLDCFPVCLCMVYCFVLCVAPVGHSLMHTPVWQSEVR